MRFDIRYRTVFTYDELVSESQNELRACPTTDDRQQLIGYRVTTFPAARTLAYTDYWGTRVDHFGLRVPHHALEIVAEAAVETSARQPFAAPGDTRDLADPEFRDLYSEYLEPTPHTAWAAPVEAGARRLLADADDQVSPAVLAVHEFVGGHLEYAPGATDIGIDVNDVLAGGVGVCQDYAHLAVAMCRSIGVPARYVSGYLFTSDDATGTDPGAEVVQVQTHAWFEAAIPGSGWIALDPTNGREVGHRHVKIGHGRDYDDVPPLRGVYQGQASPAVEAEVEIRRMDATRAPTTTVPPPVPGPVASIMRSAAAQQQQQQQ